jgi:hypothetical protein
MFWEHFKEAYIRSIALAYITVHFLAALLCFLCCEVD